MAFGISPVIPLQRDDTDGFYSLTKTLAQNIQQNFKNLVLTAPGERVMIPDFGVGLRNYLFDLNKEVVFAEIKTSIEQQVDTYMPFLDIDSIDLMESAEQKEHVLALRIRYSIPDIQITDELFINL